MKLRELKEDTNRNEVILARAKRNFISTLVADLSKVLASSSLVAKNQQDTAQSAAPETPEQKRIRLQKAAQQHADRTGAQFSRLPTKPAVWRSGRNPNGPATTRENTNFERLNKIFESMITVEDNVSNSQLSTSDLITTNFISLMNAPYVFSTKNPETLAKIKEYANKIAQTYNSPDKGKTAMEELGNWAWETMDEAKRKKLAARWGTNANPQATVPQQSVSQPSGPTINADGSITIAGAKGEQPGKVLPGDPMYKQLVVAINSQIANNN